MSCCTIFQAKKNPPRDGLTHQLGATMCKCTKPEPTLIRTEKHCDRIVSVWSDGRKVTNFLPRC